MNYESKKVITVLFLQTRTVINLMSFTCRVFSKIEKQANYIYEKRSIDISDIIANQPYVSIQ